MGTHGLLGFFILGWHRSMYNHYDAYPDSLGKDIIDFILSLTLKDYSIIAHLIAEITWVEWHSKPSPKLQECYQKLGFADLSVSNQSLEDWYCLLCKMQGAVALPAIQRGELKHMVKSSEFSMKICLLFLAAYQVTDSFRR